MARTRLRIVGGIDMSGYDPNGPDWSPLSEARWVGWKEEMRDEKLVKMPKAVNGRSGSTTDPTTWGTRDRAEALRNIDGIGFVLGLVSDQGEHICGIDLDSCLDRQGHADKVAQEIVDRFDTYCEVSPSGRGLHLIFTMTRADILALDLGVSRKKITGGTGHEIALDLDKRYYTVTEDWYERRRAVRIRVPISEVKWLLSLGVNGVAYEHSGDDSRSKSAMVFCINLLKHDNDYDTIKSKMLANKGRVGEWARSKGQARGGRELDRVIEAAEGVISEKGIKKITEHAGVYADQINERSTEFIWYPYIPEEEIIVAAASGGVGKGLFCADVAARITRGETWPEIGEKPTVREVHWYEAEDRLDAVVKPRLIAAGADLTRVKLFRGFNSLKTLTRAQIDNENIGLIILSPLMTYLEAEKKMEEMEVRDALAKLMERIDHLPCSILAIMHLNKKADLPAIERVLGPVAFTNFCRSVLLLSPTEIEDQVRLVHGKHNNSVRGDDLIFNKFHVKGAGHRSQRVRIEWEKAPENIDVSATFERKKVDPTTKKQTAGEWLVEYLAGNNGWVSYDEILDAGKEYTDDALNAAKKRNSKIEHQRRGHPLKTYWRLVK